MKSLMFAACVVFVLGNVAQAADTYSGRPTTAPRKGYNMDAAVQTQQFLKPAVYPQHRKLRWRCKKYAPCAEAQKKGLNAWEVAGQSVKTCSDYADWGLIPPRSWNCGN
jgi:hypothetical protein